MAGYSGTPLVKKLGYKEGFRVVVKGAPSQYESLLGPLPAGVTLSTRARKDIDLAHGFFTRRGELEAWLDVMRKALQPAGMVWVSWPKKAAKVPTDITEDVIRAVALPRGFVDVKVCAVDETWSGLKLVIRKELR